MIQQDSAKICRLRLWVWHSIAGCQCTSVQLCDCCVLKMASKPQPAEQRCTVAADTPNKTWHHGGSPRRCKQGKTSLMLNTPCSSVLFSFFCWTMFWSFYVPVKFCSTSRFLLIYFSVCIAIFCHYFYQNCQYPTYLGTQRKKTFN